MNKKTDSIYFFGDSSTKGGKDMSELLGGKGANLCEMSKIGMPVPLGFVITTKECDEFYKNGESISSELAFEIEQSVKKIEAASGLVFGDSRKPLLLSVRSGAKDSMPGMMDTVLNLGINEKSSMDIANNAENEQDCVFALDSYRRFVQMYANIVMKVPMYHFEDALSDVKMTRNISLDSDFTKDDLLKLISLYSAICMSVAKCHVPSDPHEQLFGAISAVFQSWRNERANIYRAINNIEDDGGTAVTVQMMVFGNKDEDSATGVMFSRNPSNGDKVLYGEYLIGAQGEDVVSGVRTPHPISKSQASGSAPASGSGAGSADDGSAGSGSAKKSESLEVVMPQVFKELSALSSTLEKHYSDMQDIEFTVESGKVWVLQTRSGKRSPQACVKIAHDLLKEGAIDEKEAILRVSGVDVDKLLHSFLDPSHPKNVIATGLPASPGIATGKVVFCASDAEAMFKNGESVVLVRHETSPEDIGGMHAASGILTACGGMTSHAAVVARGMGKCCVAGCDSLRIEAGTKSFSCHGVVVKEGDIITVDGFLGDVILGSVPMISPELSDEFKYLMSIAEKEKGIKVFANAETVRECDSALGFGADGIGLCRTEHMFFDKDKIMHFRKMILSQVFGRQSQDSCFSQILNCENIVAEMEKIQSEDMFNVFEKMDGLSVNIRLLDPPLHEFLPSTDDEINDLADFIVKESSDNKATNAEVKNVISLALKTLHEHNPMLGARGCRVGILYPDIYKMQMRAIFAAFARLIKSGKTTGLEIMIPLVIDVEEIIAIRKMMDAAAEEIASEYEIKVTELRHKVGTMIETPRACIIADEIAKHVDYFSFGTNDLTQTTLSISRDDSEKFLPAYKKSKILKANPFVNIDEVGVGELMKMAISRGRASNSALKVTVCGEHAGDAKSVDFFSKIGVNGLSCSPYRILSTRLAVAKNLMNK